MHDNASADANLYLHCWFDQEIQKFAFVFLQKMSASKRSATSKPEAKAACNGLKLCAAGRRLPLVLEAQIVTFATAADLGALLDTSREDARCGA